MTFIVMKKNIFFKMKLLLQFNVILIKIVIQCCRYLVFVVYLSWRNGSISVFKHKFCNRFANNSYLKNIHMWFLLFWFKKFRIIYWTLKQLNVLSHLDCDFTGSLNLHIHNGKFWQNDWINYYNLSSDYFSSYCV